MRSPTSSKRRPQAHFAPWLCIIAHSALSAYCGSLQYAQFERELISERTRDKMSAARRKGKWAGGIPVLGYDIGPGGQLVVNPTEAEQVRTIFDLYLQHGSLVEVAEQLRMQGWTTKRWRGFGGRAYDHASVGRVLKNVIYAGRIRHKGEVYAGEHAAIVAPDVWNRVQTHMRRGLTRGNRRTGGRRATGLKSDARVGNGHTSEPAMRVPRVARLLALALECEALLGSGAVHSYAELARLGHVSRARLTQIMHLLHLAPDLQEQILFLDSRRGTPRLRKAQLRSIRQHIDWDKQRELWRELIGE
jgi:hypothetical protein